MLKINLSNVAETSLAIGLVAVVGIAAFYVGQRYFSLFSYQNMSREQVMDVYNAVEERLPILSRACGRAIYDPDIEFCRGIYLTPQGNVLYYRLEDDIKKNKASFSLYSIPAERWTSTPELIPGLGGRVVEVDPQRLIPTEE